MDILVIAGSDYLSMNHRVHHLIRDLEGRAGRVDVVSLTRFYDGPHPAGAWRRLGHGFSGMINQRVQVRDRARGTHVLVRKLPSRLDPAAQDLWALRHLGALRGRIYDVCLFGNPDNVFIARHVKRRGIARTVIYDDWDYYFGFNQSMIWRYLMKWREQLAVSTADAVVSVGVLLSELRAAQGAKQTFVIPNGVNYPLFAGAQHKRPHPPTLLYAGTIAPDWGIDVSIKGFAQVRQAIPDARYLIFGPAQGGYAQQLHALVRALNLENAVRFMGKKPYEALPAYMAEADIGAALFRPNDLMKYAFTLKSVEYLAAGLAVVGTAIGETERCIRESRAGEAVEFSPEAFAAAVIELLSDRDRLAACQARAGNYATRYDWETLFSAFWQIIEQVTLGEAQLAAAPAVAHLNEGR